MPYIALMRAILSEKTKTLPQFKLAHIPCDILGKLKQSHEKSVFTGALFLWDCLSTCHPMCRVQKAPVSSVRLFILTELMEWTSRLLATLVFPEGRENRRFGRGEVRCCKKQISKFPPKTLEPVKITTSSESVSSISHQNRFVTRKPTRTIWLV